LKLSAIYTLAMVVVILAAPAAVLADVTFTYHGYAVNEEGGPLSGVSIKIVDQTTSRVGLGTGLYVDTIKTDADGHFSFSLAWGTYDLILSKDGFISQTIRYNGVNVPDIDVGKITLKYIIAVTVQASTITAQPGSRVTVTAQITNNGVAEESISLNSSSTRGWSTTVESASGDVVSLILKPGTSVNVDLVADLPVDASTGSVSLIVASRTTITKTVSVLVGGAPVEIIKCTYPSKISSPGGTVSYRLTVVNPTSSDGIFALETFEVSSGWSARFLNDDKEEIDSVYIQAASTATVTLSVKVPSTIAIGSTETFKASVTHGAYEGSVDLTFKVLQGISTISLRAKYPSQSIKLGVATVYPITLSAASSELLQLDAQGIPDDWSVVFKTTDGRQINSVLVEADVSEAINVAVTPSLSSLKGTYTFTLLASSGAAQETLTLTAAIEGSYSLNLVVDSLYFSTNAGSTTTDVITLTNTGYSAINNLELQLTSPDGWDVAVSPIKITTLGPNEKATFSISIAPPTGTSAKDYLVKVAATSDEVSTDTQSIRVTVNMESSWSIYGLVLLVGGIGLFALLYKKLKRK
jgi:uncharacterized membrane protein